MNYINRFFIIIFLIIISTACQKSTSVTQDSEETCFVGNGIRNGVKIDDQYIIMYKESATLNSNVTTLGTGDNFAAMLKRNNINSSAVLKRFEGDLRGFVAKINDAQAAVLAGDPMVEAIEQDRIVALGSCFTVAAPTLVTWNVNKTGFGDGTGKTAWIIDTGIESTHPDLNVDLTRSKSFITGDASFEDKNGHGTHVAGIIGAKNNLIGVLGVLPMLHW